MKRAFRLLCTVTVTLMLCLGLSTTALALDIGISSYGDGEYLCNVSLQGGTGRADVTSPCNVTITGDEAVASIEWSSPNYDYMIVDGEKYFPVNTSGNSVFEIPITAWDAPMNVVADTTAMSEPHEIEYTLYFNSHTLNALDQKFNVPLGIVFIIVGAAVIIVSLVMRKKKGVKRYY